MIGRVVRSAIVALIFAEVTLVASAYVFATYLHADIDPLIWLQYEDGLLRISVLVVGIILGLYFQDLYSNFRISSRFLLMQQICLALGIAFLFEAGVGYLAPWLLLPRKILMTGSVALMVLLPIWRILYSTVLIANLNTQRVLFLGASETNRSLASALLEKPEFGLIPIGFVLDTQPENPIEKPPVLGDLESFRKIVEEHKPDRVIVGLEERRQRMPVIDLLEINFAGTLIEDAANAYETVFGRIPTQRLRPSQLIFSRELGPRPATLRLQALYSVAIAAIGLLFLLPILLVTAILVRLTSRGPVLFRQTRVGHHDKVFTLYKFRSMKQNAEAETGAVWAAKDDPRITRFGRFMRKTRLDELPQLFNVIKGEMSIVGPRPERPEFVSTLSEKIPFYRHRHCVRPGITGWAQINHKYGDTMEDTITKLEYDIYYIKNLSPALDFYIMLQTAKVMLLSRGAQ